MIKIGEQYVNAEVEDIISKLKEVTLNQGLNYFYKSMDTPNNYMVCCPFHKNGQEKKPSMGIHKKSGVCHCFRGDTEVITQNGIFEIADLCGKQVNILNGNGEWETVTFKNYGKMPLMKINLTCNGKHKSIYATDKHEWVIKDRVNKCFTKDLKSWMYLEKILPKELINTELDPMGIVHGFCYGDGAKTGNSQVSNHYECLFYNKQDEELIQYFEKAFYPKKLNIRDRLADNGKYYKAVCFSVPKTEDFKLPPQLDKPLSYLLGFLAGYFVADGNSSGGGATIYSHNLCNLKKVRDIAIKCNIASYSIGVSNIPEGQNGCVYVKKAAHGYTLRFVRKTIPENFFITQKGRGKTQTQNGSLRYRVASVEATDIVEDVYCCETSTHSFALDDFVLTGNCFACGWTGTIDELVSNLFGYMDFGLYGYKWLIRNFNAISVEERKDIDLDVSRETKKEEIKYVTEEELDSYRYYHPYWAKRGITNKELIELFDLGYDSSTDCITFPIRDIQGRTLFVARRSVKTKYFNYPSGAEKPLYGLYEIYSAACKVGTEYEYGRKVKDYYSQVLFPKELIVCESMIDALRFWQIGKYAVALNGLGNDLQFKQLKELPCRKLILCTDMDNAGLNARKNIKSKVSNKIITEYFLPDGRKDAGECTDDELNSLQDLF